MTIHEEINKIYNSQKKSLNMMIEQNEKLVITGRTIKYRLEEIIYKCEDSEYDSRKQKCQYCSKKFTDLEEILITGVINGGIFTLVFLICISCYCLIKNQIRPSNKKQIYKYDMVDAEYA